MGVCAAITPYNFPLTLLGTKVAPALAMGNTVVAKPAATTPLATLEVARLFAEAGVPDGVLNVVTGRGADDRRRAGRPSGRPARRLHRLDRGGPPRRVDRGAADEAPVAGAGRLGPRDRVRGRRRRRRRQGGDHRPLLERRAAVPGLQARVRARVGLRRLRRSARRARAALRARQRHREGREAAAAHGPDPHPRRAATSSSSRSRTEWPAAARCSSAAARTATTRGFFLDPAVVAQPGRGLAARARGGLRAGAAGLPLHRLRRRARAAPTTRATAWARRSGRTTSAGSTARHRRSTRA